MNKELVIVFVKNIQLGKVKTRLAKTIGDDNALKVYKALLEITENVTKNLDTDVCIHFSETIDDTLWKNTNKTIQQGKNLGDRMKNAFKTSFEKGYERIVLIGSDLPSLTTEHLNTALDKLQHNDVVFGPAEDGGYYLVGLSKKHDIIFENKPWSETNLLETTLNELDKRKVTYALLESLNDIDTIEDLEANPQLMKLALNSSNHNNL
ncbi:TIGR04282 family arsenosugar biosynthesis glycosyltransferase [Tamlana sp. 2_MG-2023]|uniref:TIGR04282 family arsenosugar biosynthesis glycosyltransferase n=1 Tax=unclassified Tamlana TaxID=2614803 RepID=UPI0026E2D9B6|nr:MULTISPECIES: TIGR04282 family arsenosugar biosynthesis glycosyltransferase [unclassified Tamlana]MDO6760919.1 TIGR04282 family arsenosugar biosynthesis glycosyltransferase [Tamlana sp. 2_MG-2023]MDO6791175.1 TIGR04282 family arsenosugar biosynthesis glycosyltransferase [Tamlana sp. 1_MG-2023]